MSFGVSGNNPYNYTYSTCSIQSAANAEKTEEAEKANTDNSRTTKETVNTIVYEATAARVGASQSASGITSTGSKSVDLVILDAKKALESINCSVGEINGVIPNVMKELTAGNKYLEEALAARVDQLRMDENYRRECLVNEIAENIRAAIMNNQQSWDNNRFWQGNNSIPNADNYKVGQSINRVVSFGRDWGLLANSPEWITGGTYSIYMTVVTVAGSKAWSYDGCGVSLNWNRV